MTNEQDADRLESIALELAEFRDRLTEIGAEFNDMPTGNLPCGVRFTFDYAIQSLRAAANAGHWSAKAVAKEIVR